MIPVAYQGWCINVYCIYVCILSMYNKYRHSHDRRKKKGSGSNLLSTCHCFKSGKVIQFISIHIRVNNIFIYTLHWIGLYPQLLIHLWVWRELRGPRGTLQKRIRFVRQGVHHHPWNKQTNNVNVKKVTEMFIDVSMVTIHF